MQKRKDDDSTLNELLELSKQISLLIEDNSQNTKDCLRVLKSIQKKISGGDESRLRGLINRLLNKK